MGKGSCSCMVFTAKMVWAAVVAVLCMASQLAAYPSPPQNTNQELTAGLNGIKTSSASVAKDAAELAGKYKQQKTASTQKEEAKKKEIEESVQDAQKTTKE